MLIPAFECGTSSRMQTGSAGAQPSPAPQTCGATITGVLHDSLTGTAVADGIVAAETGQREFPSSPVVNFSQAAQTRSDATGAFKLCVPQSAVSAAGSAFPILVTAVAAAVDGSIYPASIAAVTKTTDLGFVVLGGCDVACGIFDGQQQSTQGAVIEGTITSAPGAVAGTVAAEFAIAAMNGSRDLWAVAIPGLGAGESGAFQTAAAPGSAGPCASYKFTLPVLQSRVRTASGESQIRGAAGYLIQAVLGTQSHCRASFNTATEQAGGGPLLTAPGAALTAMPVAFTTAPRIRSAEKAGLEPPPSRRKHPALFRTQQYDDQNDSGQQQQSHALASPCKRRGPLAAHRIPALSLYRK